ncbi:glycosyl hydrolase [Boeremia exigua]|uniref:glycosyl hydrolase n=1 Tax=Boeremia exigua TaxID=749465 RepID=UPI001E8E2D01|nr:glycosyl hydrolase [Boeremia exigua]KAH6638497.1 glycosyl hydrolase [Boeremia exigua]
MAFKFFTLSLLSGIIVASGSNQTRHNPALPGWHSDPSCVFVPDWDNTTFGVASTFLLTPGLPTYASKDNTNFKLASHALSRKDQYPEFDQSITMNDGIWAPTIRYHNGTFYIITIYRNNLLPAGSDQGLIFKTINPYDDNAWSDPVRYNAKSIDPDLFWDDDGTAYIASAGTYLQTVDLESGAFGEAKSIWYGTGEGFSEGPHLYRKDGFYYLMTAEGGSGLNHSVVIARSNAIFGPYEGFEGNPILTNRGSDEYFQNIGHADLFHDARGQWWSTALAWRSGPEGKTYPMGREMVLTNVTWNDGEWPIIEPVRGTQAGWYLEPPNNISGPNAFITDPDIIDFEPNSTLPAHFGFWCWPEQESYEISSPGHPGTLQLKPSFASITAGYKNYTAGYDLGNYTLVMRRQTHTVFQFSADVDFTPVSQDEEVGVTVFLNQVQNINLGIVMLPKQTYPGSNSTSIKELSKECYLPIQETVSGTWIITV